MKARSAKNKGNRFENFLLQDIRQELDSQAHRTNASGAGLDKNDLRLPQFDIEIEAKNKSQVTLISDWEQVKRQTISGTTVLAIRNPKEAEFKETLIVMDYEDWKELIKAQKEQVEVNSTLDPALRWPIKAAIEALRRLLKLIDKYNQ